VWGVREKKLQKLVNIFLFFYQFCIIFTDGREKREKSLLLLFFSPAGNIFFLLPLDVISAPLDKAYIRIGAMVHDWASGSEIRERAWYWFSFSPEEAKALQIVRNDFYWLQMEPNFPGELGIPVSPDKPDLRTGDRVLYVDYVINQEAKFGWDIMFLTFAVPNWARDPGVDNSGYWSANDCGASLTENYDTAYSGVSFAGDNPRYNEDLGTGAFPKNPLDWSAWVTRVARRYGSLVDYWNFGNEGNLSRAYADGNPNKGQHLYWTGSEQMWRDMFIYGYNEVHQNDDDGAIVFPGGCGGPGLGFWWTPPVGNVHTGFIDAYGEDCEDEYDANGVPYRDKLPVNQSWLERFITGAHPLGGEYSRQGARGYFDALGIHTYARASPQQCKIGAYDYDTYEAALHVLQRRAPEYLDKTHSVIIADETSAWPWFSEPEPTLWEAYESVQADHISRCIGELLSAGCNVICVYRLFDPNPGCGDRYWGMHKFVIPHRDPFTGELLDTKNKRIAYLNKLYHPGAKEILDIEEYPADNGAGYLLTWVKVKDNRDRVVEYNYKARMLDRPNKYTDPFHPSWYRLKYWSQAGAYRAYRVRDAVVSGLNNYDHQTAPSYKIVSYSDWADRYVVLIYTKQSRPTATVEIPTHWPDGTTVELDKRIDGDALDSDGNYTQISKEIITVNNGRIRFSSQVNRFNTFILTRQGIDPFAKKIVLTATPQKLSLPEGLVETTITAELQNAQGQIVTAAKNPVIFSVSGGLQLPPLYVVRPINGRATIKLTAVAPGISTVTATADGLVGDEINIVVEGKDSDVTMIKLASSINFLPADGVSVTTVTATLVDKDGNVIETSTQPITFSLVEGSGMLVDDDGTTAKVITKNAVNGRASVMLRAASESGYCVVKASSPIPGVPKNAIWMRGYATGSGFENCYAFRDISHTPYTIKNGDVLQYDVYIPTTSTFANGGIDFFFSDWSDLRSCGAGDQYGLSVHSDADLSAFAYGRWYRRSINLPPTLVGRTIGAVQLALTGDKGNNEICVANVKIISGTNTVTFYGEEPTHLFPPDNKPPDFDTPNLYANVTCSVIPINTYVEGQTSIQMVSLTPAQVSLSARPTHLVANGVDVSTVTAEIKDSAGHLISFATYTVNFSISGEGVLIGRSEVTTSNGIATTYVRATNTPGQIVVFATVTVSPTNILSGSITIRTGDLQPYRLLLTAEPQMILANGVDVSTVTAYVVDQADNICPTANNLIHFYLTSGNAILEGQNPIYAQSGIARIRVRSTNVGTIKISASAEPVSLLPGEVTIIAMPLELYNLDFLSPPPNILPSPNNVYIGAAIKDSSGAIISTISASVTLHVTDNVQFTHTQRATTQDGVVNFEKIYLPQSGIYNITISGEGLISSSTTLYLTIDRAFGGEVKYYLAEMKKFVTLSIPRNSIDKEDIVIIIQPESYSSEVVGKKVYKITVYNARAKKYDTVVFNPPATLHIPYQDVKEPIGIVDGTVYNELDIRGVKYIRKPTGAEEIVPIRESYVNVDDNYVIIPVSALSSGECYSIGYGGSAIYETLKIEHLINYPNPVAEKGTYFVFGLTKPASVKIKIYTLAGILVKTIIHNGVAGYNEVYWSGLDENDNKLSNGVYIYKLIADDGNEKTTEVGRLAIIR